MKKFTLHRISIALILAACAQNKPASSLIGTTWKLISYGRQDSLTPVMSGEGALILYADGQVTGVGACNEFNGTFEIKGKQITFSHFHWGSAFCPEPQMTQESTVWDTMDHRTVDFRIEDKTLTITRMMSTADSLVLVFEAVTDSTGK